MKADLINYTSEISRRHYERYRTDRAQRQYRNSPPRSTTIQPIVRTEGRERGKGARECTWDKYSSTQTQNMIIIDNNVRWNRGKEGPITKVTKHTDIIGLSETWFNEDEICHTSHVNLAINHKTSNESMRSSGKAALIITTIIKYTIIREMVHPEYQFIAMRFTRRTVAVCYISQSAKSGRAEQALLYIRRRAENRAIEMGDIGERHKQWDVMINSRESAVERWSMKRGRKIQTPTEMTCYTERGSWKLGSILCSGVQTSTVELLVGE